MERWPLSPVLTKVANDSLTEQGSTSAGGVGLNDVGEHVEGIATAVGVDVDRLCGSCLACTHLGGVDLSRLIREERSQLPVVVDLAAFTVKLQLEGDGEQCT